MKCAFLSKFVTVGSNEAGSYGGSGDTDLSTQQIETQITEANACAGVGES